jgi:hypothetical protein
LECQSAKSQIAAALLPLSVAETFKSLSEKVAAGIHACRP